MTRKLMVVLMMIWQHISPLLDYMCWQQISGQHDDEMGCWDAQVTRTSTTSSVINTIQKGTLASVPSASDSVGCSAAFLRVLIYGEVSCWRHRGKTNYLCILRRLGGLRIRSGLLMGGCWVLTWDPSGRWEGLTWRPERVVVGIFRNFPTITKIRGI